jgi:hypothetical protein
MLNQSAKPTVRSRKSHQKPGAGLTLSFSDVVSEMSECIPLTLTIQRCPSQEKRNQEVRLSEKFLNKY